MIEVIKGNVKHSKVVDLQYLTQFMTVIPVPFSKYHKEMLGHTRERMEYEGGCIAIRPQFTKLITALRTAVEDGNGNLDKGATSHNDLLDAFRLSLQFWS